MLETNRSLASEIAGPGWLQTFAETTAAPASTPAAATAAAASAAPTAAPLTPGATVATPAPLVGTPVQQPGQAPVAPAQPATPPAAPAETDMVDVGGYKVPLADPSVKRLVEDYKRIQGDFTRTRQELIAAKALGVKHQVAAPAAPTTPTAPTQQAPAAGQTPVVQAPAAPALPMTPEQFTAALYGDDPLGAVNSVIEARVNHALQQVLQDKVQPLSQTLQQIQDTWTLNQEVADLSTKYQDFDQMAPAISKVMDEHPELLGSKGGLEMAYKIAKAESVKPAPTLQEMLADPALRQQLLADPAIRNQIIQEHLTSVSRGAPPPVIAAVPGAVPVTAPATTPKNMSEATKAMLARLNGMG